MVLWLTWNDEKFATFRNSRSWALGPPINYEKTGGASRPPLSPHRFFETPVPPILHNFSRQVLGNEMRRVVRTAHYFSFLPFLLT